jgi:hypothetical protein
MTVFIAEKIGIGNIGGMTFFTDCKNLFGLIFATNASEK